jgi:hypothetical protein
LVEDDRVVLSGKLIDTDAHVKNNKLSDEMMKTNTNIKNTNIDIKTNPYLKKELSCQRLCSLCKVKSLAFDEPNWKIFCVDCFNKLIKSRDCLGCNIKCIPENEPNDILYCPKCIIKYNINKNGFVYNPINVIKN